MTAWLKESNKKDALYVDIFRNNDPKELASMYYNKKRLKNHVSKTAAKGKTRDMAIKGRIIGNEIFVQKKYYAAMKQYNMALCFAIHGSEEMALLYGNRSACYFELKMFDKCLTDIELAKKAKYPQHLMEKLNKRKADADESIAKGLSSAGFDPKLSYDASEQIPVMANAVKIDIDDGGRRVIATKNLAVGEVIHSEPLYVGQSMGGEYTSCSVCLKDTVNLIPCKKCISAMFCCECVDDSIHRIECDIRDFTMQTSLHETNSFQSIIRTILMAIELFPTVDNLMEFVEQNKADAPLVPQLQDAKAKYKTFLNLPIGTITPATMPLVYCVYQTLLDNSEIAAMFNTNKYRRFLMHLILHHNLVLKNSSLVLGKDVAESTKTGENMAYYYGLTYRLFRHSCVPNVIFIFRNGSSIGIVTRPVKANEELFISLINNDSESSYNERQRMLMDLWQIQCDCELCVLRLESLPIDTVLKENMEYLTLIIRSSCYVGEKITEKSSKVGKVDIEQFLQKYGRRIWSEELRFITHIYHYILMAMCHGKFHE